MVTRRTVAGAAALWLAAGRALSHTAPDIAPAPADSPFTVDTGVEASRRMTVPVLVNGQGPFHFVVDTGADRTVMSARVAAALALAPGPAIQVHGIAGTINAPTVHVASAQFGKAVVSDLVVPVLPDAYVGADGLLGLDALDGRSVVLDFRNRQLIVGAPPAMYGRARAPNETIVPALSRFGRLTVLDTRVEDVRALAFLDTGGGATVGNLALASAIRKRLRATEPDTAIQLVSATGQAVAGTARIVERLSIGRIEMARLPMIFCDLHLFDLWGLNDRPTLLLGIDAMRAFSRVELDFRNQLLFFKLGAASPPLPSALQAQLGMPLAVG